MEEQEIKAKILNKLFKQYADQKQTYLHSEFIHHDKKSPKEIIPLLFELINIKSAIDVGCGLAAWLKVLQDFGIDDVMGIDGEYVKQRKLMISPDNMLFF